MKSTLGVIGNGFVGGAVVGAFCYDWEVKVYDKDKMRSLNTEEEVIHQDIVFICLPTPMVDAEGGDCNLSILENALESISIKNKRSDNLFAIKSTVPIGTTKKLKEKYPNLNIVHSPEFLTAKNARVDFISASRHIVGIPNYKENSENSSSTDFNAIFELYKTRFPGSRLIVMDSNESEFVKYACNCFFATKVMYFNEIKLLADKIGIDWNSVMNGILSDGRISQSHSSVPGHDGDMGFGGTCFPKDINAFIRTIEQNGINPIIMKSVWEQNKNVRTNWDWASSESAVKKQDNRSKNE
jgi:UDPglucose 6-dehydrogenase